MSVDDDSFHPLGKEWETELEESLDETEYDTELGLAMAEDAMRVTKGELSEEDFHEKYHEAVMDEFGVDDRPTAEAFEESQAENADSGGFGLASALERFDGDGEMDRREMMKKMGVGAAAVGFGLGTATAGDESRTPAVAEEEEEDEGTQLGMVIDLERCDGCLACVQGCEEENGWDAGMNWMYVMAWEDEDNPMPEDATAGEYNFLVRPCQHCTDAPCEKVCPTTARHTRKKDGLVLTDYDVCIGCRYCQVACPYGVNYFQWNEPNVSIADIEEHHGDTEHVYADYSEEGEEEDLRRVDSRAPRGVMSKCTMCPTRQDGNMGEDAVGTTACEDACAEAGMNVIHFGDMNDPESKPNQYLERREREAEANGPNYVSPDEVPGTPLLSFGTQESDGETVEVSAQLPAGGFVAVYDDPNVGPSGDTLLGVSEYLEPGVHDGVEIELDEPLEESRPLYAAAHVDSDDDESFDYVSSAGDEDDLYTRQIPEADVDTEEGIATVEVPELTEGGFVVLYEGYSTEPGDVLANSEYLEAGEYDDPVEIELDDLDEETEVSALVHRDSDDDEAFTYVDSDGDEDGPILTDNFDDGVAAGTILLEAWDNTTTQDGNLSTFRLFEDIGTNPNVLYIGNEPGPRAHQTDGPVAYEDLNMTHQDRNHVSARKDVTDERTVDGGLY